MAPQFSFPFPSLCLPPPLPPCQHGPKPLTKEEVAIMYKEAMAAAPTDQAGLPVASFTRIMTKYFFE